MTSHEVTGIVSAEVTPFDAEGNVDEGLHWTEVRRMLASNVNNITVGCADIRISTLREAFGHVRCVGGEFEPARVPAISRVLHR